MRISLALPLVCALAAPAWAQGGSTATLTGRVLPASNGAIHAKAIWAGAVAVPVAADGSFRADGLPGGPTALAIETSEGLYLAATPVTLAPGSTRRVQLAFGGRQDSAPPPADKAKAKKPGGVWSNPVAATAIVIGSAIVVGVAVDQLTRSETNSTTASPSAPVN